MQKKNSLTHHEPGNRLIEKDWNEYDIEALVTENIT